MGKVSMRSSSVVLPGLCASSWGGRAAPSTSFLRVPQLGPLRCAIGFVRMGFTHGPLRGCQLNVSISRDATVPGGPCGHHHHHHHPPSTETSLSLARCHYCMYVCIYMCILHLPLAHARSASTMARPGVWPVEDGRLPIPCFHSIKYPRLRPMHIAHAHAHFLPKGALLETRTKACSSDAHSKACCNLPVSRAPAPALYARRSA